MKSDKPAARIDIDAVAHLARLEVAESERAELTRQMEQIIAFAGALEAVDTEGVPHAAHALPLQNVLRQDVVAPSLPRQALMQNAPAADEGCFRVPPVLEREG